MKRKRRCSACKLNEFENRKKQEFEEEIKTPPQIIKEAEEEIEVEEIIIEPIVIKEAEEKPKEENEYMIEEFVEIDGKKVSKFDLEPVVCLNTGMRYENNKVAMQETGVNSGAIKRNCRGFTKSAGKDENGKKLVWKFEKDVK